MSDPPDKGLAKVQVRQDIFCKDLWKMPVCRQMISKDLDVCFRRFLRCSWNISFYKGSIKTKEISWTHTVNRTISFIFATLITSINFVSTIIVVSRKLLIWNDLKFEINDLTFYDFFTWSKIIQIASFADFDVIGTRQVEPYLGFIKQCIFHGCSILACFCDWYKFRRNSIVKVSSLIWDHSLRMCSKVFDCQSSNFCMSRSLYNNMILESYKKTWIIYPCREILTLSWKLEFV